MKGYAGTPPKGHRFWRASEAPTLVLRFDKDVEGEPQATLDEMRVRYAEQGRRICALLAASLPGGLFDALAGAMLERKASLLIVPHDCGQIVVMGPGGGK